MGLIGKISKGRVRLRGIESQLLFRRACNLSMDINPRYRVAQNIRGEFLAELLLPGVGTPPEPRAEHNGQPGGKQPKSNIRRNCGSS